MGPDSRRLFTLITSICVIFFFSLLAGCGGSSHSSTTSTGTTGGSTGTGTTGTSSTGTGSSGTGSSGTGSGTNTGSTNGGGTGSGSGSGSTSSSYVSYVYTAGANSITGYGVNSDGSLTAVSGSPYASATDTYVVTNGSNLYTVDADAQTLKVYAINQSSGALTPGTSTNAIVGNPNPADIVGYLSLDHTGTSLYVGTFDSSGDDGVNFFTVGSSATATEVAYDGSSEVFGPPLVFSTDNKYAYSGNCYHASWTVFSYTRASNGTLTSPSFATGADGPPVLTPNEFACPVAFAISASGYLAIAYVPTPQGGTYMIGTYKINSDGSLTAVSGSQATTASTQSQTGGDIAINFDPTGTYLAVAGNGGVQTYAINSTGILSQVAPPQDAGVAFENVGWDKSNHVFATSSSQLYVWTASSGQLTPANGSPYGGGAGLAVLPLQ